MSRVLDMVGKQFGNLTVIRRDGNNSLSGQATWVVRCNCERPIEFVVLGNNLRRGNTTSCPCVKPNRGRKAMAELRNKSNESIEKEMLGKCVGKLTVMSKFDIKGGSTRWLCRCSCGRDNNVVVRTAALRSESRRQCKYCRADGMKLATGKAMRNHLLRIYKCAAKRRGHCWELTNIQFDTLTQSDCHYCGKPPSERKHNLRFNGAYKCNGIDRKDNTAGYIISNCLPSCSLCNQAKNDMPYDDFIAYLKKAGQFQLGINTIEAIV